MSDITIEELIKNLKKFFKKEENKNYIYLSLFFIIFSFFLIFVIRPTLKSAFQAKIKRKELISTTSKLESVINKAVNLQIQAEKYREDFLLLYQALPESVKISQLVRDINQALQINGLRILRSEVSDIVLVGGKGKGLKKVELQYTLSGKFSEFLKFLDVLENQRRIKLIDNLDITKIEQISNQATGEAKINVKFKIVSFFL